MSFIQHILGARASALYERAVLAHARAFLNSSFARGLGEDVLRLLRDAIVAGAVDLVIFLLHKLQNEQSRHGGAQ